MKTKLICVLMALIQVTSFCSVKKDKPVIKPTTFKSSESSRPEPVFQAGIASWYGGKFQGRRTANGEIYDKHKLTAAHKTLPFNTIVEVRNLINLKKVLVRINDRGPFIGNRIIDLSRRAAQEIGMVRPGIIQVSLRIIKKPGSDTFIQPTAGSTFIAGDEPQNPGFAAGFYLQAGAYAIEANARRMLTTLKKLLPEAGFYIREQNGLYRVLSTEIASRSKAEKIKDYLEEHQIESLIKKVFY